MASTDISCSPTELEIARTFASVESTLGLGYYGVAVSGVAYGVTCCQLFYYFQSERSRNDHWLLRRSIAASMLVITAQQILIVHAVHHFLIPVNPCVLFQRVIWSIPAVLALNTPVYAIVGGFFIYRVWQVGGNPHISGICAIVMLAAIVLYAVYAIQLATTGTLLEGFTGLRRLGNVTFAVLAAADACTSAALVWYFYHKRIGFRRSDSLISRLIQFTISANILTTGFTLANFVVYVVATDGFWVIFFSFLLDKLFVNAMLTTLNLRRSLSKGLANATKEDFNSIHLSRVLGHSQTANQSIGGPIATNVNRVVEGEYATLQTMTTSFGASSSSSFNPDGGV